MVRYVGVSLIPDDSPAWPSALGRAAAFGPEIESVQRQIRQLTELLAELRRQQRAWEKGGRGEQAVIRVLVGMNAAWHVLADRRWPGTRRANIDVLLAGPGGVFVIDVKTWRAEVRELVRWGVRLPPDRVEQLVVTLDRECPPMPSVAADAPGPPADDALVSREELWQAMQEAAGREPIESWMTWLHPLQAKQVSREFSGPSRIRGGAGTGKTVLALHRANYLASRGRRVLFTSFVRTLPAVHEALFARLAPARHEQVTFLPVHVLASRWLRENPHRGRLDAKEARACFDQAWESAGEGSSLPGLIRDKKYWGDEISVVIKGRGLADFGDYAGLARVGRRAPLSLTARADVWQLYETYRDGLAGRGILDWADALRIVRDLARQRTTAGADNGFDAVIVDEVQDLTCVGLQFLHALVGDRPDGLLMVGDGQQSVYPGGFTLSEAGISVVGRSTVLNRNYRNGERILRYALTVVAGDQFDDLDADPVGGRRDLRAARPGGAVVEVTGGRVAQGARMCEHIRKLRDQGVRYGDLAVLAPGNTVAARWRDVLAAGEIPVIPLAEYSGTRRDQVKVGTFHRAKGLEFAHVFIPDRDRYPRPRSAHESDGAYRERTELERRVLFVAMTRARDGLWLGLSRGSG